MAAKKLYKFPISHFAHVTDFFMAWAHGHKTFLYLSGCAGWSPKIVQIAYLRWCRKSVLDKVWAYIPKEQLLLYTGVPLSSFWGCVAQDLV